LCRRGVQVYLSSQPNAGDVFPTAATAADIYAEMDFSNCDPNQAGVDGADCQGTWAVKPTTPPGRYTLMWWWEFNAGEYYNTCADVMIAAAEDGGGGGGGGAIVGSPPPPGGAAVIGGGGGSSIPAIGVLAGECQSALDGFRLASARMAPPTDTEFCVSTARTVPRVYGQVTEVVNAVDLSRFGGVQSCPQLFQEMESLCTAMSTLALEGSASAEGGMGTVGGVFLGLFLGFAAGVGLMKYYGGTSVAQPAPATQPGVQIPPAPTMYTVKGASAYKNISGQPPPPPPGPPPGPPPNPYAAA